MLFFGCPQTLPLASYTTAISPHIPTTVIVPQDDAIQSLGRHTSSAPPPNHRRRPIIPTTMMRRRPLGGRPATVPAIPVLLPVVLAVIDLQPRLLRQLLRWNAGLPHRSSRLQRLIRLRDPIHV